ncbi:hypothetical protein OHS33_29305 [Streptomyces sp. NBC_00536]|uniref:hypothetical protein n=1 Tax=Streptomyces sp. NBC_00536 TaxID=2975769 RepID=UPI002E82358F|nr:hypothetical protein [Streptomyces sp. NBC_00536]WUC82087.1 hypothetical protein OHS33_29305 [Streptomyces sp. NBC_00536]
MAESVPVRCPACLRENGYTAPSFPCACGSPVTPALDLSAPPRPLTHRTWSEAWVAVRCGACGQVGEWPHPEVGCTSCGTVVRVPVLAVPPVAPVEPEDPRDPRSAHTPPLPAASGPRPAFRPVTIRTAGDAVSTAALYLRWLGFPDVRRPDAPTAPAGAVDLRAPGLVAQVDPTTEPAGLRAVECVWLNGLTSSATSVYFSLAGYTQDARARADDLGIPLFVMDLTGMPQPVNDPADELVGTGARD